MKKHLFNLVLFLSPVFVNANNVCDVETLLNKIRLSSEQMNSEFKQTKQIKTLLHPLNSSGKIWLDVISQQLVWQVINPIKSTMVISGNGIHLFNRYDVQQKNTISMIGKEFSSVFLNIASGNLRELQANFAMNWQCGGANWIVELYPKVEKMKKIIHSITIRGERKIDGFTYIESRGDLTDITLLHTETSYSKELSIYLDR